MRARFFLMNCYDMLPRSRINGLSVPATNQLCLVLETRRAAMPNV